MLSRTLLILVGAGLAAAQYTPLVDRRYNYANVPYQVDTIASGRGPQSGYSRCNSTTLGQSSMCQTQIVNSIQEFCIWASPTLQPIADTEGEVVAWCTTTKPGARVIPPGTLSGVQFLQLQSYVQITGFLSDQTQIDLPTGDSGGELDSAGQDARGNPLGGLTFTNAFGGNTTANSNLTQVVHWTTFVGGNAFCLKVCDESKPNAALNCQHTLDRIGCAYNAPSTNAVGTFESCQGQDAAFPGVYTVNGVTSTYAQPAEGVPIGSLPYTATPPVTSNCQQYTSSLLYTDAASYFASISPNATMSQTASQTASGASGMATGSASAGASASKSASANAASKTGDAVQLVAGTVSVTALIALLATLVV